MEHSPEIPSKVPPLTELLEGVIDEEYSLFFVCNERFTADVVQQAGSDSEVGRAQLLADVAENALAHKLGNEVKSLISGGLTFFEGPKLEMIDFNEHYISENLTLWYVRLSRQDAVYLYTKDAEASLEQTFLITFRNLI